MLQGDSRKDCVSDDQFWGGKGDDDPYTQYIIFLGHTKKLVFFLRSELKYRLSDIILFKTSAMLG